MIQKIKEELDSKIKLYTKKEISACIKNPGTCKPIIYTLWCIYFMYFILYILYDFGLYGA